MENWFDDDVSGKGVDEDGNDANDAANDADDAA